MSLAEVHEQVKILYVGKYLASSRKFVNIPRYAGCQSVVNINTKQTRIFLAVQKIQDRFTIIVTNDRYGPLLNQGQVFVPVHPDHLRTDILPGFQNSWAVRVEGVFQPIGARIGGGGKLMELPIIF